MVARAGIAVHGMIVAQQGFTSSSLQTRSWIRRSSTAKYGHFSSTFRHSVRQGQIGPSGREFRHHAIESIARMESTSSAGVADSPAALFAGAMPKGIGALEFLKVHQSSLETNS